MFLYCLIDIFHFLLLTLPIFFSHFIKINYIWGTFNSHFTFFHAIFPALFDLNSFSFFYGLYYVFNHINMLKIPGIINSLSFFFLQKKRNKFFKIIVLFLFLICSFYFIFFVKKTFIYAIPWLLNALWILLRFNQQISLFEISFFSTWLAQAYGTIIYGLKLGFLNNQQYIFLLPIALCERFIFVFLIMFFIFYKNIINFYFESVKRILKKTIHNKN